MAAPVANPDRRTTATRTDPPDSSACTVVGHATIAIFSLERDLHAHAVAHELRRRHGATCHIVATDRLFDRGGLSWEIAVDGLTRGRLRSYDGVWFEVSCLDAVWWRRVNQPLREDERLAGPDVREFVQNEWRAALFGVVSDQFRGRWINRPHSDVLAGNKLYQLTAAQNAGLRVPATLVSRAQVRASAVGWGVG